MLYEAHTLGEVLAGAVSGLGLVVPLLCSSAALSRDRRPEFSTCLRLLRWAPKSSWASQ